MNEYKGRLNLLVFSDQVIVQGEDKCAEHFFKYLEQKYGIKAERF